ncbi:MAG TPA: hypothetical protein VM940_17125 [Chthoniobacterales bacterium]|jgi:hypothetical protein|nr:hypothetical protein [Chthoniobacterales bacterium]
MLVTPGKQFVTDELVTLAKLNQLGNPVVKLDDREVNLSNLSDTLQNILSYASITNALMNPQFDFSTRLPGDGPYTTFLGGTVHIYSVDRWVVPNNTEWSRVAFPVGQTSVPDFPRYMLHIRQAAPIDPAINPAYLGQRVIGVQTFAGKEVTWAIYARADSDITVQMQLSQFFGTGGSPSPTRNTTAQSYVLPAGEWTQLVYTTTLPSVSGKILGTINDWVEVRCILPQGAVFQIDFAHAQFQLGGDASYFQWRPHVLEISLCNLFYERTQAVLASSVATHYPCFYFNTPKRNIPSLILGTPTAGSGATILPLSINGFYQNTANSAIGISSVQADAELYP